MYLVLSITLEKNKIIFSHNEIKPLGVPGIKLLDKSDRHYDASSHTYPHPTPDPVHVWHVTVVTIGDLTLHKSISLWMSKSSKSLLSHLSPIWFMLLTSSFCFSLCLYPRLQDGVACEEGC